MPWHDKDSGENSVGGGFAVENIIIIVILACLIAYSIYYIYKAKKSGAACIGCSASKGCNGKCCACSDEAKKE